MAYLDQLESLQQIVNQQRTQFINQLGITPQAPYASFYPAWETTTPQYQTPSPYSLAGMGYRTNELVYTCTNIRAQTVAEAPIRILNIMGDEPENIANHGIRKLLKRPTPGLSEQEFWQVVETYLCIAGFSAWEKERNNKGEVIRLWPMRPDWCSFIRGQQKPIAALRYQPWGMQYADIPIEDVVLFQYFDPIFPLLKGFSPLMVALDLVDTDNTATRTIRQFLTNGNYLGGVLKTEQKLQDAEAERIRERWRQMHGGPDNAGMIAVLGSGADFTKTSMTFREATFPELDARSEARICMVYRVPPMLIGAKIGMDRSTYSNYREARAGFYESVIASEWKFLAGQLAEQLLPDFENDPENFDISFDTSGVKALQENRTETINRAISLWKSGMAKLNEARIEAGFDKLDDADGGNARAGSQPQQSEQPAMEQPAETAQPPKNDNAEAEIKAFRKFAKTRIKENKSYLLASFEFKHISLDEQNKLLAEFGIRHDSEIIILANAINQAAERL